MARTQAADYDERREAIVEKAAQLYAESGFLGCSIADLARACGISKSLLYHYFGSKEDILFAIMDGHVEALLAVAANVADEPDATARLRLLTRQFLELYRDATARHKVLVNDLDKLPEPRRRAIVTAERHLLETMDGILAQIAPSFSREPGQPRATTMLYFGMINWTHTWYDPDGAIDPRSLADLVVDIMLKGVSGR